MHTRTLTLEKFEELLKKQSTMMNEYNILLRKSPEEMWRDDLEELIKRMRIIEKMS